jgi:hypothetical protein
MLALHVDFGERLLRVLQLIRPDLNKSLEIQLECKILNLVKLSIKNVDYCLGFILLQ